MSSAERSLSTEAERLFTEINQDTEDCCTVETLGRAETLLLLKVFQDHERPELVRHAPLIDAFVNELKSAAKEDTDQGSKISQEEFTEAFLSALHVHQKELVGVLVSEVAEEYKKMDDELTSTDLTRVQTARRMSNDTI